MHVSPTQQGSWQDAIIRSQGHPWPLPSLTSTSNQHHILLCITISHHPPATPLARPLTFSSGLLWRPSSQSFVWLQSVPYAAVGGILIKCKSDLSTLQWFPIALRISPNSLLWLQMPFIIWFLSSSPVLHWMLQLYRTTQTTHSFSDWLFLPLPSEPLQKLTSAGSFLLPGLPFLSSHQFPS